jgi:hypothetical protein
VTDIELHPDFTPAPATLFQSPDPGQIVAQATRVADVIAPLIRDRQLAKRIGASEHVYLEGWTLAGTMLGVFPITVASGALFDANGTVYGYQATVEARTMAGAVVGRADAECTRDENPKWRDAPSFQLRSMAQTRASSKALRMPLGFVMKLAGYDTTPAEEMEAAAARGESVSGGRGVAPGWRDKLEQDRGHRRLHEFVTEHDLEDELAAYLQSKGYATPLAKGQLSQVEKAMVRELQERGQQTTRGGSAPPPAPGPTSDPGSPRPGSDPNASVTGQGDTDASAGHEPPNAEAPTSPRPATSPAGRGGRKSRSEVPGGASAGTNSGETTASGEGPPTGPQQAVLDQGEPEPPGWD